MSGCDLCSKGDNKGYYDAKKDAEIGMIGMPQVLSYFFDKKLGGQTDIGSQGLESTQKHYTSISLNIENHSDTLFPLGTYHFIDNNVEHPQKEHREN